MYLPTRGDGEDAHKATKTTASVNMEATYY